MKKIIILTAFIFQFAILANAASAMCVCGGTPAPNVKDADCLGPACTLQADSPALSSGGPSVDLKNPISANSIPALIGQIINVALGIVGSLALIMFIYGGFTWMLAAGNEQAVEKGRNILVWATIGLVVIFASYSLVNFIINTGIRGV
jgi:hypothetical protein